MTDKELMEKADSMRDDYWDWWEVSRMAEQAQSEEARNHIERLSKSMYHKEEYANGIDEWL